MEIKAYEILKSRFSEQEAEALLDYIETKASQKVDETKDMLATKENRAKLEVMLADTKAEMVKWLFIFWIGRLAATFAFLKFFAK